MAKKTPENDQPEVAEDDGFIPVAKDGEIIRVCPEQVEQHQRLGWVVQA